jgi:hypothetical protein
MAINQEFLGRLDREIASLKGHNEQETSGSIGHSTADNDELLRETEARLKHLEELREKLIEQSTGG